MAQVLISGLHVGLREPVVALMVWALVIAGGPALSAQSDGPSPRCPLLLSGVPLDEYIRAAQSSEVTLDSLKVAEDRIIRHHFASLPVLRAQNLAAFPGLRGVWEELILAYSSAVSAAVRGFDELIDSGIQEFVRLLDEVGIREVKAIDIRRSALGAARDPLVYPSVAMAEFIIQRTPTVEAILLLIGQRLPEVMNMRFAGVDASNAIFGGPRQAEMIRTALTYTITRPGDRVLEIGYGNPSVLLGYGYFTQTELTGIDPLPFPEAANETLAKSKVRLVRGSFPEDTEAMKTVRERGPYSVILALDTLKPERTVFQSSASPRQVVKSLFELLDDGGTLVILNDFAGPPNFTEAQARAVGFKIVRWGEVKPLNHRLRALMPYDPRNPNAGVLKAYVLRRGQIRRDRIRSFKGNAKEIETRSNEPEDRDKQGN